MSRVVIGNPVCKVTFANDANQARDPVTLGVRWLRTNQSSVRKRGVTSRWKGRNERKSRGSATVCRSPLARQAFGLTLTDSGRLWILRRIPKYSQELVPLDRMFHALADPSRRAMVERLVRGPASVSELARPLDMALPSVVQHLGVLEAAGIVTSTKVGRVRTYQLAPDALTPAATWISQQRLPAERRLDRLGQFLARPTQQEPET